VNGEGSQAKYLCAGEMEKHLLILYSGTALDTVDFGGYYSAYDR
jgi:hypothetical protein